MNLNQVTLKSRNVSRSVAFYQTLGLRLIVDSSPRYVRFECPNGTSTFSVSHSETAADTSTTLYFEVEDLDRSYHNLKAQGLDFNSAPEDKDWLWRETSLQDPDGHPLILFTAGKNRRHPPWRIQPRLINPKPWYACFGESPVNLMK